MSTYKELYQTSQIKVSRGLATLHIPEGGLTKKDIKRLKKQLKVFFIGDKEVVEGFEDL